MLSVAAIGDELKARGDELSDWVVPRDEFFVEPDADVLASLGKLSAWAASADYDDAAISQLLGSGDYSLIGHGHAKGLTVVTHESPGPRSKKRLKIPDACMAMKVPCIDPFEMLKAEGAKFVLCGQLITRSR